MLYPYYIIFDPRKLGYKILSGYVWSYLHCSSVKYVAKTDDNVVLDLDKLLSYLDNLNTDQAEINIRTQHYILEA